MPVYQNNGILEGVDIGLWVRVWKFKLMTKAEFWYLHILFIQNMLTSGAESEQNRGLYSPLIFFFEGRWGYQVVNADGTMGWLPVIVSQLGRVTQWLCPRIQCLSDSEMPETTRTTLNVFGGLLGQDPELFRFVRGIWCQEFTHYWGLCIVKYASLSLLPSHPLILVLYCCVTLLQTYWLKTALIYYFIMSMSRDLGHSLIGSYA